MSRKLKKTFAPNRYPKWTNISMLKNTSVVLYSTTSVENNLWKIQTYNLLKVYERNRVAKWLIS